MPYFAWRAITLDGSMVSGKSYARSQEDLDAHLLVQDKALLRAKILAVHNRFKPVSYKVKTDFFKELAMLIRSGMYIDQALRLLSEQSKHQGFSVIIKDILMYVQEGISFSQALSYYPTIFDLFTIQILQAGQESGTFVQALEQLCSYYETIHTLYTKLRSAALVPGITFLFFLMIVAVIFMLIIPSFAHILTSAHTSIPYSTQCMLGISAWMCSVQPIIMAIVMCLGMYSCMYLWREVGKAYRDVFILRVPVVGFFVRQTIIMYWLYSLGLLVQGGVAMVQALEVVEQTISNIPIKAIVMGLHDEVESGLPLYQAMSATGLFIPQVIGVVQVGEESGCLGFVLSYAADMYKERMNTYLSYITTAVYPVLMIIIGLLITVLIFSVYMPILNISYIVT